MQRVFNLRVKTADISNACFQGKELDRVLLLDPPREGPLLLEDGVTPDPELADGVTKLITRVPIYGTLDAGRFFWKQMRETCLDNNPHALEQNIL